jgi:hypothetical protein
MAAAWYWIDLHARSSAGGTGGDLSPRLSLATPVVIAAATSLASGLLVTRADAIEHLAQVNHVFDTGTLTLSCIIARTECVAGLMLRAVTPWQRIEQAADHPIVRRSAPKLGQRLRHRLPSCSQPGAVCGRGGWHYRLVRWPCCGVAWR